MRGDPVNLLLRFRELRNGKDKENTSISGHSTGLPQGYIPFLLAVRAAIQR